jgi:hypothetical protein
MIFTKLKTIPLLTTKALGGEDVLLLLILNLGIRWGEWSASRSGWYPLDRRLGGPQSRSGHIGYRKNPLPLTGIEPVSSCRPIRSQTLY